MAVGPSPPREMQSARHNIGTGPSPPKEYSKTVRVSPYRDTKERVEAPRVESVSVGPSPPRENRCTTSPQNSNSNNVINIVQKKSTGTSPPRGDIPENSSNRRSKVSTTGTSPPPQTISTQVKSELNFPILIIHINIS